MSDSVWIIEKRYGSGEWSLVGCRFFYNRLAAESETINVDRKSGIQFRVVQYIRKEQP